VNILCGALMEALLPSGILLGVTMRYGLISEYSVTLCGGLIEAPSEKVNILCGA
jgi:hypothetical protein